MTITFCTTQNDREKNGTQEKNLFYRPVEKNTIIKALPLKWWKVNLYDSEILQFLSNTSHVEILIQLLNLHFDLCSESQFKYSNEKFFYTKKRNQQKMQRSQFSEILKGFVIGSNNNVGVTGTENLEPQTNGRLNIPDRIVDCEISACQNQVVKKILRTKFIKRLRMLSWLSKTTCKTSFFDSIG